MRKTKYVMSGGLAFAEEKDMEKLRRFSLKGWHVRDYAFMGYILEKGERKDYIYSIDYRPLEEGEAEEYFDFFSDSGWAHIASDAGVHLFQATSGTKPIYTDRDTSVEKYSKLSQFTRKMAVPFILVTALFWFGSILTDDKLKSILLTVAMILSVFALPAAWTGIAAYSNKWEAKGKIGIAKLLKFAPVFIFLIAVLTMLVRNDQGQSVQILIAMIIGGFGAPAFIWLILSLYHKIRGMKA